MSPRILKYVFSVLTLLSFSALASCDSGTGPEVTILTPRDNATITNALVTITGTALDIDGDITGLEVSVVGTDLLSELSVDANGEWTTQIDFSGKSDGRYTILATAIDKSGLSNEIEIVVNLAITPYAGTFSGPYGAGIDAYGDIYVADRGNNIIKKFSSSGHLVFELGSDGYEASTPFTDVLDVAVDLQTDEIFVFNRGAGKVCVFSEYGVAITSWGSLGTSDGQFTNNGPGSGVVVDGTGRVLVTDSGNHRIQVFNSRGTLLEKFGSFGSADGQFAYPGGIAVDSDDNIYVADTDQHRVQKFTSAGVHVYTIGIDPPAIGSGTSEFNEPFDMFVDKDDVLYVPERFNHRIQRFTAAGVYVDDFGSVGSGDGQFNRPASVVVDQSGNVYVVDGTMIVFRSLTAV